MKYRELSTRRRSGRKHTRHGRSYRSRSRDNFRPGHLAASLQLPTPWQCNARWFPCGACLLCHRSVSHFCSRCLYTVPFHYGSLPPYIWSFVCIEQRFFAPSSRPPRLLRRFSQRTHELLSRVRVRGSFYQPCSRHAPGRGRLHSQVFVRLSFTTARAGQTRSAYNMKASRHLRRDVLVRVCILAGKTRQEDSHRAVIAMEAAWVGSYDAAFKSKIPSS